MAAYVRGYGPTAIATPTKADRWLLMEHAVHELGFFPNSNFARPPLGNTPWAAHAYTTVGFEIWEQLGRRAPELIVLPIGHGEILFGVYKSFRDLRALGLASMPELAGGEVYGSLRRTLASDRDEVAVVPIKRDTVGFSIATAQSTYLAAHALRASGGWVEELSDQELLAAQRLIALTEGLLVETASAAALAALQKQVLAGNVDSEVEVVFVNTSAGVKAVGVMAAEDDVHTVEGVDEFEQVLEHVLSAAETPGRSRVG
jgi:threonine synthase